MQDNTKQAVAREIRAALARDRHTQRDLAAVLGVTQASVAMKLNGSYSFRAEEIIAICAWLGIDPASVLPIPVPANSQETAA